MYKKIKTVKEQTRFVLENYISARNSDAILYKIVAKIFYGVDLGNIEDVCSLEGISRSRRHFQEQGLFKPEQIVGDARKENKKDYKKEYCPKTIASGF